MEKHKYAIVIPSGNLDCISLKKLDKVYDSSSTEIDIYVFVPEDIKQEFSDKYPKYNIIARPSSVEGDIGLIRQYMLEFSKEKKYDIILNMDDSVYAFNYACIQHMKHRKTKNLYDKKGVKEFEFNMDALMDSFKHAEDFIALGIARTTDVFAYRYEYTYPTQIWGAFFINLNKLPDDVKFLDKSTGTEDFGFYIQLLLNHKYIAPTWTHCLIGRNDPGSSSKRTYLEVYNKCHTLALANLDYYNSLCKKNYGDGEGLFILKTNKFGCTSLKHNKTFVKKYLERHHVYFIENRLSSECNLLEEYKYE